MTTTTTTDVTANAKHTEMSEKAQRRYLAQNGVRTGENANGMYMVDADDEDGAKWWPTVRCDDQLALILAYEAGAGAWHS